MVALRQLALFTGLLMLAGTSYWLTAARSACRAVDAGFWFEDVGFISQRLGGALTAAGIEPSAPCPSRAGRRVSRAGHQTLGPPRCQAPRARRAGASRSEVSTPVSIPGRVAIDVRLRRPGCRQFLVAGKQRRQLRTRGRHAAGADRGHRQGNRPRGRARVRASLLPNVQIHDTTTREATNMIPRRGASNISARCTGISRGRCCRSGLDAVAVERSFPWRAGHADQGVVRVGTIDTALDHPNSTRMQRPWPATLH